MALHSWVAPVLHTASPLLQRGAGGTPVPWFLQDMPLADTVRDLAGLDTATPATPLCHSAGDRWKRRRHLQGQLLRSWAGQRPGLHLPHEPNPQKHRNESQNTCRPEPTPSVKASPRQLFAHRPQLRIPRFIDRSLSQREHVGTRPAAAQDQVAFPCPYSLSPGPCKGPQLSSRHFSPACVWNRL